jgi:GNAT superfamily N-acetyltransferase
VELTRGEFTISTDPGRIDMDVVYGFLAGESYWSRGIARERLERAIRHSLCFGLYQGRRQIGFARVISDRATYAYVCDVFLLEAHRGRGLGAWLMQSIAAHPELAGLRRWMLVTRDAQPFYETLGWNRPARPDGFMEIVRASAAEPVG